jgi:hypothetical protein
MKVGQTVLLKQGLKLIKAVVISIDTDFVSLDVKYDRNKGSVIRLRKDSKDIIKLDFTHKEVYKGDVDALAGLNNFMA